MASASALCFVLALPPSVLWARYFYSLLMYCVSLHLWARYFDSLLYCTVLACLCRLATFIACCIVLCVPASVGPLLCIACCIVLCFCPSVGPLLYIACAIVL